jgi:hypothetical protein
VIKVKLLKREGLHAEGSKIVTYGAAISPAADDYSIETLQTARLSTDKELFFSGFAEIWVAC